MFRNENFPSYTELQVGHLRPALGVEQQQSSAAAAAAAAARQERKRRRQVGVPSPERPRRGRPAASVHCAGAAQVHL